MKAKLTKPQIAALMDAANLCLHYRPNKRHGYSQATIEALRRRGLVGNYTGGAYHLTEEGRAMIFGILGGILGGAKP